MGGYLDKKLCALNKQLLKRDSFLSVKDWTEGLDYRRGKKEPIGPLPRKFLYVYDKATPNPVWMRF